MRGDERSQAGAITIESSGLAVPPQGLKVRLARDDECWQAPNDLLRRAPERDGGTCLRQHPAQQAARSRGASTRYVALPIIALSMWGCAQLPPADVPAPSPSQGQAVVLDIDGTLTPNNLSVYEPRPGAAEAVSALSNMGYKIVYLTTRIPPFQSGLPDWLRQNGFPEGSLHVAQSGDERDHAYKFKVAVLNAYLKRGWRLAYAYGDSSTDFAAYAEARIPKEHVFALKRRGSKDCQDGVYQACLEGWTEHLPYIGREIASAK